MDIHVVIITYESFLWNGNWVLSLIELLTSRFFGTDMDIHVVINTYESFLWNGYGYLCCYNYLRVVPLERILGFKFMSYLRVVPLERILIYMLL
jgi:hypothetical protein